MSGPTQEQVEDFLATFKENYERTVSEVLKLPRSEIRVDVAVAGEDESAYNVQVEVFIRGESLDADCDESLRVTKAMERLLTNKKAN